MSKKKETALLQQTRPQDITPETIIADLSAAVKDNPFRDILEQGVALKDTVEIIRRLFPGFDKSLGSKCANAERYGAVLHPLALAAVLAAFPEEAKAAEKAHKPKKKDGHKLVHRISARLTERQYRQLQRHLEREGYETMQEWLTEMVTVWLAQKEGKHER